MISISSSFIKLVILPDPTHSPIGGGVSINHTSSNRIELSQLGQDLFDIKQYDLTPPIDPLNHSSTQLSMHPPMGGGSFSNHKSSNRIELSQLGQDLFNC